MAKRKSSAQRDERLAHLEQILTRRYAPIAIAELAKELAVHQKEVGPLIDDLSVRRPIVIQGKGRLRTFELAPAGGGGRAGAPPPNERSSTPSRGEGPKRTDAAFFDPRDLDRMVISLPLRELIDLLANERYEEAKQKFHLRNGKEISLIIDLNLGYPGGLTRARHRVFDLLVTIGATAQRDEQSQTPTLDAYAPRAARESSGQYVFAWLDPEQLLRLIEFDRNRSDDRKSAIYRVWPDNLVRTSTSSSLATIKADAASATFSCTGEGIVWAVLDSGIDGAHPHFRKHANLHGLPPGIAHMDFTDADRPEPLVDGLGHGTHVAGIIAGELKPEADAPLQAAVHQVDERGNHDLIMQTISHASGVAPKCKLVSFKVVTADNVGPVTGVMAALEEVNRINGYGKMIRIQGVNMSLGYPFEARWFACGHSPLCDVVDRLVKSGVVVVVAAGNNGYGMAQLDNGSWGQGLAMSITDPGNAEGAITVGSTHRDSPHTFGVSFFSSKGPTGDGRNKPDILAPGERIVSCAARAFEDTTSPLYKEDSGTSMAAPHVSGAIAAFLSVRREFIGKSEAVKDIFLKSALDLKRNSYMQGHGLLDLLRALQSV